MSLWRSRWKPYTPCLYKTTNKNNKSMWNLILPLLTSLPGALGKYFEQRNTIEMKKLDNQLSIEVERSKLIAQGVIIEGQKNIEQIKATSAMFKQFIYCVMLSPIVITCFSPDMGREIFSSLNIVPEWYIGLIVTIGLAMWGINSDKVSEMIQSRRAYKLAKLDRKNYYAALRKIKGVVTQQDVDLGEKLLDEMEKE